MTGKNIKIFINYRRADEPLFAELIRTHFMQRYGRENVFMDFDTIPPFARFEDFIRRKVRESDAIVSIMGPRWLDLLHEKEQSEQPDFVRIELTEALKYDKIIAPIAIQGAHIPHESEVPEDLTPIFARNIPSLRPGRNILENINPIMDALEEELKASGSIPEIIVSSGDRVDVINSQPDDTFDIHKAIGHFYEALETDDLPSALLWISQMKQSGEVIPEFFQLGRREQELRSRLQREEEERRKREVAEYQYEIIRLMKMYNESDDSIQQALEQVWQIYDGYDPDNIAEQLSTTGGVEIEPVEDQISDSESRYNRLGIYLKGVSREEERIRLTFAEIEEIVEHELPNSAYQYTAWWSNNTTSHTQSRAWLSAGWRITKKNLQEKYVDFARIREREQKYIDFFSSLSQRIKSQTDLPVISRTLNGESWLNLMTLPRYSAGKAIFDGSFTRHNLFRIELYIDTGDQTQNKYIFDKLYSRRSQIEKVFGDNLEWERLDDRRASRIAYYCEASITDTPEKLEGLMNWSVVNYQKLVNALTEPFEQVYEEID